MTNERTDPEAMYDELVAAIVKAVPGIRWKICHHGEQADCEHRWQWRKITLEDVLQAMPYWAIQIVIGKDGREAYFRCQSGDLSTACFYLGHDLAWHRDNAQETIAFLHSHICT